MAKQRTIGLKHMASCHGCMTLEAGHQTSHVLECRQMYVGGRDLQVARIWLQADVVWVAEEVEEVSNLVVKLMESMRQNQSQWSRTVLVKLVDALELVL